jgi:UDP-glucuronate 4-epimerase
MKILVTGAAGFIGFHLAKALTAKGFMVTGLDNINDYYDPELKYNRLKQLGIDRNIISEGRMISSVSVPGFEFVRLNLEDTEKISALFAEKKFDIVCHLAAQAGVRYSLEQPMQYIQSNIVGFTNILEACKNNSVSHLVYASSSSVYGLNSDIPFKVSHHTDHPVSLYAATKKSNELMAHVYSHLYKLPTTGLRFFTVYGPWGRPDMAYFLFTDAILNGRPIKVFNGGEMRRDFTYIDDIVEGIVKLIDKPSAPSAKYNSSKPDPSVSNVPFRVYNIGNNSPVNLLDFIETLEKNLGIEAKKNFVEMQPGDVTVTYADVQDLIDDFGFRPSTSIQNGIERFVKWYRDYYRV